MTAIKSAYLDANAVIRFVESEDDGLLFLFEQAAAGLLQLVTSELTLAEVLVGPLKDGDQKLAGIYEEFLTSDETLEIRPVDRSVLRRSAEIRATLGNKGPDAIHIATALLTECSLFFSSDQRLRLPANLKQIELTHIHDTNEWL
ncbi:type II toxin-antitoxin system VapC family toxin [Microvirga arsenatis]|uniref:PIN domain-containing protein n=1 Tax=Microvirga arsenatis TaxID=2692265 RepID=A0ABW9YXZ2_9HYPH|nr:PIN domain-containing protein [Microvirga arsenatis]NBJ11769.1 PIN domain-containing protein [Microvirga arsenatis]NBJ25050.1 PIN domain-containing protein [Microvirga arsenatis]